MKKILLWIWCFPQNLIGFIVKCVTNAKCKGDYYWFEVERDSMVFGEYIFLCPAHYGSKKTLYNKIGHRALSRIFGWLYLPLIALPSTIWKRYYSKHQKELRKKGINYYWFPTEKWADKLAGIER